MPFPMPMAGPGAPGMGAPPLGGPPNPGAMMALKKLLGGASPDAEKKALDTIKQQLGAILSRSWQRSPEAAKDLASALKHVESAKEKLEQIPTAPVGAPPDLLGGLSPAPMGMGGGNPAP